MTITVSSDAGGTYGSIAVNGVEKLRLNADGSATLDGNPVQRYKAIGTKATTSGTAIDFSTSDGTGIPSWATRVTLSANGVSTNGTSTVQIQLMTASGVQTSGYAGACVLANANQPIKGTTYGTSFALSLNDTAADFRFGSVVFIKMPGSNTWVQSGTVATSTAPNVTMVGGSVTLPSALTGIRVTTTSSDVFDGGAVSLIVEG
jgi:hypothetical protein